MTRHLVLLLLFALLSACVPPAPGSGDDDDSAGGDGTDEDLVGQLEIQTTMGSFEIQLFLEEAPATTANFLTYVEEGFYDGDDGLGATVFHRVIADFMIQGGGQTADGTMKDTHSAIVNEAASSGLSNLRGTLAMARTNAPDSATSQFFVNVVNNDFLDAGGSTAAGYAVFGEVIGGMDVVDAIGGAATDGADAPRTAIVIEDIEQL